MSKGASSAGRAETVAGQTGEALPNDPAPAVDDQPAADHSSCVDCGSEEVVYVTEDPAAESKAYCANCKPANVTDAMVEEQQNRR